MKKINLMLITHDLAIGGLQRVIVNICQVIDRRQFNVSVLCLRTLGDFSEDIKALGINVFYLEKKTKGANYFLFFQVAKLLKQEKIDVIHTHNTQPFVDGTLACLFAGVKGVVHTDHARSFPDKKRYMFAEWLMSLFAHKVVGVSEHTSKNLIKYEKISKRKIVTIPNGVNAAVYRNISGLELNKEQLGLPYDAVVLGLGARLSEQKGLSYLIRAMPGIIAAVSNAYLVIAGEGELELELKKLAEDLGVKTNVLFLGPRSDMPSLLKIFDLYISSSLWEGLPMSILEAMAAGCPIVTTDVGGIRLAIKHGVNGLVVPPKDVDELTVAITSLLTDDEKRASFSNMGKDIFDRSFSAEIMTRKYEELYRSSICITNDK